MPALSHLAERLAGVSDQVREISHGIHPAILSSVGLRPALRALGRRSAIPVDMNVLIEGHLPEPVEVGAYYVVSEMLTNAAKHARASAVVVDVETSGGTLRLRVRDDGIGGADPLWGSGLTGLTDRIEALGGIFSLHSPQGGGTAVSCEQADSEHNQAPSWYADGELVHTAYEQHAGDDDWSQAGTLVREVMDDAARDRLVSNIVGALLAGVTEPVLQRAFWYLGNVDKDLGDRVEKGVRAGQQP